jgi:hypothetical protein
VQLTNGLWIKIKSHWWRQNQWSNHKQASAKEQEAREQSRLQVLRSRSKLLEQRLAAVAWPKGTNTKTVKRAFPEAVRAEMVYDDRGKLKVVMVSFKEASQCEAALRKEAVVGKRTLVTGRAYSRRARSNGKNRVMVHTWLEHGKWLLRRRDTEWGKEEEHKRKQQEQDILIQETFYRPDWNGRLRRQHVTSVSDGSIDSEETRLCQSFFYLQLHHTWKVEPRCDLITL